MSTYLVKVVSPILKRDMYFDTEAAARRQANSTWAYLRGTVGGMITLYDDNGILLHCNVEKVLSP